MSRRPLLASELTPAQLLHDLVTRAGYAPTRHAFADLAGVDRGNVFNYLAPNGSPQRVPAETETIRGWARTIESGTGNRVRIGVTEGEEGEVIIALGGLDIDGSPVPELPTAAARPILNHDWGTVSSRKACDAFKAAITRYRPSCRVVPAERRCVLKDGRRAVAYLQHRDEDTTVRVVLPSLTPVERDAVIEALGVAPAEGSSGDRGRLVFEVGDRLHPATLARALSVALGWWSPPPVRDEPLANEVPETFAEGDRIRVHVNRYERDPGARAACIASQGDRCVVCGFSFSEKYGPLGEGFIHVHHVTPLHTGSARQVDPTRDLVPVCANCHCMLHRGTRDPRSIDELRALVERVPLRPSP